jgi:hypothetical protein
MRRTKTAVSQPWAKLASDAPHGPHSALKTHEYGHVHFHAHLFEAEPHVVDLFNSGATVGGEEVCKHDGIISARKTDWMEWQAG